MKKNFLIGFKSFMLAILTTLMGTTIMAQVSGIITDASTGDPLIGASILLKDSTVGTITDIDGQYSIAAGADDVLVFSYTGFEELEEVVGNRSTIDIALSAGALLSEVVVTGYGTQSRRSVTGAVSSVEIDELRSLPTGSVENALQGRVAGVQVSTSGAPGSATLVRVRGFGTINNNQPLYIIDGLPVQGGIIELNPNDIKTMTVLKDASAASIYGSRASNGVIIITTKNGSVTGKPTLTFDSYIGTQWASNFPSFVNPQQFAELEAFEKPRNLGQPVGNSFYGTGSSAVLPDYLWPIGGSNVDESTYAYSNDLGIWNGITRANKEGTDWFDEIFNSALVKNYNISASGGTEKAQYTLGVGHLDQDGTRIHSGFQRSNIRANSLFRIKDNLRIGQNLAISYSRETGDRGVAGAGTIIGNASRQPSIVPVFDISGINFSSNKGLGSASGNAVQLAENRKNNLNRKVRALGSVFLEVDILDDLTAKTSFSVDFANTDGRAISLFIPNDSEPLLGNSVSRTTNQVLNWTWYNTLTYNTTLAEDHDVSVIAGTEAIENEFTEFGANRIQFLLEDIDFMVLDAGPADGQNAFGRRFESSLFSIFGKVDYTYKGKYLLSGTLRRDGSSRFGANNRYAIFPAVSVGWRVSDEDFFSSGFINDLKIRGGWGKTGNQEIDNLAQYTLFSTAQTNTATYAITGSNNSVRTGIQGTNIGNPDLKWEETTDINVGMDATLVNNHVNFSLDVYKRNTKNLLLPVPPSTLIGAVGNQFRNVGEVQNTGFDLALGYNNSFANGFSLDMSVVGSRYKNEVIALDESIGFIAGGSFRSSQYTRTLAGFPISSFFGLETDGIFQTQAEVDQHVDQPNKGVGRFRFTDINNDGTINADDRTYLGDPHPDFTLGWNTNIAFKGFDFSMFWQGSFGNDIAELSRLFTDLQQFQGQRSTRVLQSFGREGLDGGVPNSEAILPIYGTITAEENGPNSYYIQDGSYFRLKNTSLGYTLGSNVASKIAMQKLRIYVQATNIITFTGYEGIDPEVQYIGGNDDLSLGLDGGFWPVPKTLTFGITADF